ncbi:Threonylcarbamoyl-AMP synthase [Posidoniimonas polymericola]|uniref:Threonylcarbamoyl-AMP synthase n=1 Tax=Posidoniimonas polymericola TaxID=2528002 RepID=A0A5C5YRG7_9BACT|nr:L-threonylcarbamoyladenylate synthase [Posidoniimonas polymericola]TWT77438.1 Threonylcarbamoyl-AMP synthase [Posidoniimonas polymericola]
MGTALIQSPREAAEIIRAGGVVAFPTETVFGLGVDATNDQAVRKLFQAKGRPSDNPLIVHIADAGRWSDAAATLTPTAEVLLSAFAPGPLTVLLPKRAEVSDLVTAGLGTVGIRAPNHPIAAEILRLAGRPVAAPSANRSGRPSGTRWRSVLEDLDGRIDAVFQQDGPSLGVESTVVDCTGPVATVLRAGAVTIEQIRRVLPDAREVNEDADRHADTDVRSPGTLHPHYQPRATVRLVDRPSALASQEGARVAYCGLLPIEDQPSVVLSEVFNSLDDYAAGFYEFLREADRQQATVVFVQRAPDKGIGHALLDRQQRAAGER